MLTNVVVQLHCNTAGSAAVAAVQSSSKKTIIRPTLASQRNETRNEMWSRQNKGESTLPD